jgi:tetratricopeptide (TPR) repeat protein
VSARVLALIRVAQAEEACKAGRHQDAERIYAQLLTRVPEHPDALNNRALCLVDLGRLDEARADLEVLVKLDPRHAVARGNLAEVCYRSKDDPSAREHYTSYVALRRPGAKEWKNLGEIYRALGDFPRAAHCWARSVETEPDQPAVRDLLDTWIKLAGTDSIPGDLGAGD